MVSTKRREQFNKKQVTSEVVMRMVDSNKLKQKMEEIMTITFQSAKETLTNDFMNGQSGSYNSRC